MHVINYSENISDEEKVVNYLTIKNDTDRKEIEKILGLSKAQTIAIINKLLKEEKIAKIGLGPSTKYSIR